MSQLDTRTYKINLPETHCVGNVPNGGYALSRMLAAANDYLPSHPHTFTAHAEFPGQTSPGDAVVTIEEVRVAKRIVKLHLTLWQGDLQGSAPWIGPSSRRCVVAYTNHIDFRTFEGLSVPTGHEETTTLPPGPDGGVWVESRAPDTKAARNFHNYRFLVPKEPLKPGVMDCWMTLRSGDKITQDMLPWVVDSQPFDMHNFLASSTVREMILGQKKAGGEQGGKMRKTAEERSTLWMPTVVLNFETKGLLPDDGVEWLHMRVTGRQMRDGRTDMDIEIRDKDGDLVALSQFVSVVVSISKSTGKL